MGEEMTIILAMMFAGTVGFMIAAGFNSHSYDKGRKDGFFEGRDAGYETGYKEGTEETLYKLVAFPNKEGNQ